MVSTFKQLFKAEDENDFITIVSGLPRSGTSMMMRMLEAGGMEIVTDNLRTADEDNPRGYYEDERVKKMKEDSSWLDGCRGKVVKVISMLLYDLPAKQKYKVIFMRREMEEILSSQRVMLQWRGQKEDGVSDEEMAEKFEKHLRHVEEWLGGRDYMNVLYIKYNDVINNTRTYVNIINNFLGKRLNVEEMMKVVEKSLYRQRKAENAGRSA